MIQTIHIKNYKGFEDLTVKNIKTVNLIGGENNIGKTSLLEAIFTFYDEANAQIILNPLLWRGIPLSTNNNSPHEIWLPVFREYNFEKNIEFEFEYQNGQKHNLEIGLEKNIITSINPKEISHQGNSQETSLSEYSLKIKGKLDEEKVNDTSLYFSNKGISMHLHFLKGSGKPRFYISQLLRNSAQDALKFSEAIKNNRESEILESLKLIDSRINSIVLLAINDKESVIHVDIGMGKKIPIYYLGDGAVRLLEYTLAILNAQNGFVFIDEIENGLHYSKQKDIWKLLFTLAKKYKVQIFATTHSKEMAEAFASLVLEEDLAEEANYIELFRHHKTERITANSIDAETLAYKIQNHKSFRGE